MYSSQKLHFIVGIGRSGTTILTKLLNNHSDIHCLPEANFLVFFLDKFKGKTTFTNDEINNLFEQIKLFSLSNPWVGWEFDINHTQQLVINWVKENNDVNYENLCKIIYQNFKVIGIPKENAKILLDKNPSFTLFVDRISNTFRDAKFIFIIRDYRANILSRKQSIYLESANVAYNAYRWKLFNKKVVRFQKNNKDKIFTIRYEDLVKNPDEELKKICRFLNVNDAYMLTLGNEQYKNVSEKIAAYEKHKHRFEKKYADLSKSINQDRLDSWKTELSTKEIEICDAICGNFSNKFGYATATKLTTFKKLIIQVPQIMYCLKAYISVYKEFIIFKISIPIKLNRLRKVYKKLGFT